MKGRLIKLRLLGLTFNQGVLIMIKPIAAPFVDLEREIEAEFRNSRPIIEQRPTNSAPPGVRAPTPPMPAYVAHCQGATEVGKKRWHGTSGGTSGKSLSVLLASASFGGTIAAVRHFAKHNIDVGVVSSHRLGAAAWSRHVARAHSAPPESEGQRFLERLVAIGAADPGRILLARSDETAWIYAENAVLLARYFFIYQPLIRTLHRNPDNKFF